MQLYDKNKKPLFGLNVAKAFASGGEGSVCEHPQSKAKVVKAYHKSRDLSWWDIQDDLTIIRYTK